jgi:hypothetical protein
MSASRQIAGSSSLLCVALTLAYHWRSSDSPGAVHSSRRSPHQSRHRHARGRRETKLEVLEQVADAGDLNGLAVKLLVVLIGEDHAARPALLIERREALQDGAEFRAGELREQPFTEKTACPASFMSCPLAWNALAKSRMMS